MSEEADVVVVGAGFAGLVAVRDLGRRGHRVLRLEARVIAAARHDLPHDPWLRGGQSFCTWTSASNAGEPGFRGPRILDRKAKIIPALHRHVHGVTF